MPVFALALFTVFAAVLRLVPHPANFAPIGALALFAGAYAPRRWGMLLPLAALLASDAMIGFYDWRIMAAVYGSLLVQAGIGRLLRGRASAVNVVLAAVGGALFFFIATNFAVWAFSAFYAKTWEGLLLCYTLAVPFFRNTLLGDLVWSGVFFGGYALARQMATRAITPRPVERSTYGPAL